MELYFAYGSNLNINQMRRRCPSVRFFSKALLKGYKIDFPLHSSRWGGGVAGIVPKNGKIVEGVIYELSKKDLKKLDLFEGVDKRRYNRKKVKVLLEDGSNIEAWTYFTNSISTKSLKPSKKYIETIISGAREHHLSESFIEDLEHIKN